MRDVLVDVRLLQDPKYAQTEAERRGYALLGQARAALPRDALVAVADPALPPLREDARALFDCVRFTASVETQTRPAIFVQLSPLTHDPLFVARLLKDSRIFRLTVAPGSMPDAAAVAERMRMVVARHWLEQYDLKVGEDRLWDTVAGLNWAMAGPAVVTGERAQVLLLDPSGDDGLRSALESVADVHVAPAELFTEAMRPRYDRVVGVVANTSRHTPVITTLARYGGTCLLRDGGLLQAYTGVRKARGRAIAASELRRAVGPEEFERWIAGDTFPRARLLGEVVAAAQRVLVHSETLAAAIASGFGRSALVLPVPLSNGVGIAAPDLGPSEVPTAERRIVAFATGLMAENCIWMLDVLRHWGVSARLRVFGSKRSEWDRLQVLSERLALADRVTFAPAEPAGDEIVADAGIFLGMRGQGSFGVQLAAAAGRGLPCVASESVAEPFAQPEWVRTIPDVPSPVLLAEAVAAVLSRPGNPILVREWAARNRPEVLARRLAEALELG